MYTSWEEFEINCKNCTACGLADTRTHVVVGRGSTTGRILFVGEGPGEQEDKQGLPFVGPAGQLLDLLLEACAFHKEDYYIANIVKCRPPFNRDPTAEESRTCMPHLRNQFALIKPEVIVCLGRISAQSLIDPALKITRDRGQWVERKGVKMIATFHPAAILHDRDGGNLKKKLMFDDMMKVRRYLNEQRNQA